VQAVVVLTGGRLPWEIAIAMPEAHVEGWSIACAEYHRGEAFDFTPNGRGDYVGFSKKNARAERPQRETEERT
jgi:hypothetical protein